MVAERVNCSQKLLDVNEIGVYSSYTLTEDLVAERISIDSYREMINFIGNDDPTTRRMLDDILAMEEEHADDMNSLLVEMTSH